MNYIIYIKIQTKPNHSRLQLWWPLMTGSEIDSVLYLGLNPNNIQSDWLLVADLVLLFSGLIFFPLDHINLSASHTQTLGRVPPGEHHMDAWCNYPEPFVKPFFFFFFLLTMHSWMTSLIWSYSQMWKTSTCFWRCCFLRWIPFHWTVRGS